MTIGRTITMLRKKRKMSQRLLSRRSGIVAPYISRIEMGHVVPSIRLLEELTTAMDLTLVQFFTEREKYTEIEGKI